MRCMSQTWDPCNSPNLTQQLEMIKITGCEGENGSSRWRVCSCHGLARCRALCDVDEARLLGVREFAALGAVVLDS